MKIVETRWGLMQSDGTLLMEVNKLHLFHTKPDARYCGMVINAKPVKLKVTIETVEPKKARRK